MSTELWMSLIGYQDTSSGGPLRLPFERPSDLKHWIDEIGDASVALVGTFGTSEETYTFWIEDEGETAVKRLLSSLIVQNMPETGLDEAFNSLVDIYEFHFENMQALLPEPDEVGTSAGKVIAVSDRPELLISE